MKNGRSHGKYGVQILALKAACILVFVTMMLPSGALAASEGFFIGYGLAQVKIGGDMDGNTYVGGGGSMEVLPDQPTDTGSRFLLGWQYPKGAFEIGQTRSEHDGEWGGLSYPTTFTSLNLDFKYYVNDNFIRPLLLFGMGFTSVKVKNGSTDLVIERDATFHGFDVRLGAGAQFALSKHLAADAQIVYRWGSYSSVDGIASGSIGDDVDGNGTTTSVDIKYIF